MASRTPPAAPGSTGAPADGTPAGSARPPVGAGGAAASAVGAPPAGTPAAKAPAAAGPGKPAAERPRRRLSVDERREQLIAVALELFSLRPPEEVSIDDIAAAAGASRPLVYHYFPGKQALYEESLRRAGKELAG